MKNLTRVCLMAFTFFIAFTFEIVAFNNSTNLTRKKNDTQLKNDFYSELRCCEGWYVDYNDCGVLMLSTVTKCTYNETIPIEKVCEAANSQALKNFTYACESEGPK